MELEQIIQKSIKANLTTFGEQSFFVAGQHQFKTIWTRDFCFSVPGLLATGYEKIVKNQIQWLIDNTNADGLVPLYGDSMNPMKRVAVSSLASLLWIRSSKSINSDLKPYYLVDGKYPNIDSNLLLLKAVLEYCAKTQDFEFFLKNEDRLVDVYKYYDKYIDAGLIHQPAHSDWKDSARREGAVFLTNLLYSNITEELGLFSKFNFCHEKSPFLRRAIEAAFKCSKTGLYKSEKDKEQYGIEDQLLAIKWNWLRGDSRKLLWDHLTKHPLWTTFNGPLIATYPNFQSEELINHVKWAGLHRYHDTMTWSWIVGLAFKVSLMMNDTQRSQRILEISNRLFENQETVFEIYNPQTLKAKKTWLYWSEEPFLWGASSFAEAIDFLNHIKNVLGLK